MKLLADEGVVALGIELGISQHAAHRRSMCMGLSDQCRADWNKMSCLSRSTTDGWPRLSRASRFDLTLGHDSAMRTSRRYGMRERPINSYGLELAPTRGTRGLLSMRTTAGYGCWVRSIQYSRTANLRAAATLATAFGFLWQRCRYSLRNSGS